MFLVQQVARRTSLVVPTTCHLPRATCTRRARMLAGARRAVLVAGLALAACSKAPPVVQPIQFSHKAHVEKGLPCDGCHQSVEKAAFAGMPTTETCMMCHQGALTDNPEEEKVRQYATKGMQIPWQRVYAVAGHVYFSHRRHVTLGHVECVQCHGNVGESAAPLTVAAVPILMDRCMSCHAQKGAAADCDACHR